MRPLQTRGGARMGRPGQEGGGRRNIVSRGKAAATGLSGTSEPLTDREKDFEGLKDMTESEEEHSSQRRSKSQSRHAEGPLENWV